MKGTTLTSPVLNRRRGADLELPAHLAVLCSHPPAFAHSWARHEQQQDECEPGSAHMTDAIRAVVETKSPAHINGATDRLRNA